MPNPSLYALSVPTFLQTLGAVQDILARAARHCAQSGMAADDLVTARLVPDMAPFHFQIESVRNHAVWGLDAVRTGRFTSPPLAGAVPFAHLQAMIDEAVATLAAVSPDEIDGLACSILDIEIRQPRDVDDATRSPWVPHMLATTPEGFLLSYSIPNFYFHAVTAYNILRLRGVPLGKYHFQGVLRTRGGGAD